MGIVDEWCMSTLVYPHRMGVLGEILKRKGTVGVYALKSNLLVCHK